MTSLAAYNIVSDSDLRLAAEQLRGLTGTKKGDSAIRHRVGVGESVKIADFCLCFMQVLKLPISDPAPIVRSSTSLVVEPAESRRGSVNGCLP